MEERSEGIAVLDRVDKWAQAHKEEVNEVVTQLQNPDIRAIFIKGGVHSGKTTLSLAVARALQSQQFETHFTTAAIQQTPGARPIKDRTGTEFRRLPSVDEIQKRENRTLIVIDEAKRKPEAIGGWRGYAELPNARFIVLTQPENRTQADWEEFFNESQRVSYQLDVA